MKKQLTQVITYRWWRTDGQPIPTAHEECLTETANDIIHEQVVMQGNTSGELTDNIRRTDDDPQDGIAYRGSWELKTVEEGDYEVNTPTLKITNEQPNNTIQYVIINNAYALPVKDRKNYIKEAQKTLDKWSKDMNPMGIASLLAALHIEFDHRNNNGKNNS